MKILDQKEALFCHRQDLPDARFCFVWGHGWGQSHQVFLPMMRQAGKMGAHVALDFPGFGRSLPPPENWGTADYADAIAGWVGCLPYPKLVWVGHSFGCRVGLQIAARHPDILSALILIAPAGLKRRRTLLEKARLKSQRLLYKGAKVAAGKSLLAQKWRDSFGSADYRAAGKMKSVFVRVVSEDLSDIAAMIRCKTLIICGADDKEAPPEISKRLVHLIPTSELAILDNFDHQTILSNAHHQILHKMSRLVEGLNK